MSIVVQPRWQQRGTGGESPSAELDYVIIGTNDMTQAELALVAESPVFLGSLGRREWHVEQTGPLMFDGFVSYGSGDKPEKKQIGQASKSWEIGFKQERVYQSLDTTIYHEDGRPAPSFGGAIGVSKDGVEGVDVPTPTKAWSEKWVISLAQFYSGDYEQQLWQVAKAPVNNAPFRGHLAGEVLFRGATGDPRDEESAEVSFKFEASPNLTDLVFGTLTGIEKRGWEYIWPLYEDEEDDDAKLIVQVPRAAYVEQVIRTSDFANLGIGTGVL